MSCLFLVFKTNTIFSTPRHLFFLPLEIHLPFVYVRYEVRGSARKQDSHNQGQLQLHLLTVIDNDSELKVE